MRNLLVIHALVFGLLSTPAVAENDDWQFLVAPYFWGSGLKGTVGTLPPAPPADVDASFSDILDNLDFALMGFAEARKDRFGLFGEVLHMAITADGKTPGPLFDKAELELDMWTYTFGGLYALSQAEDHNLDVVGGFRFWDVDNALKFRSSNLQNRKLADDDSWNDFIIGIKGRKLFNENWYVSGWLMGAVAGDSDSFWDIFGGVGYQFSDLLGLTVGYRYQEVDYESGDFLMDIELSGPAVGLTFRF